MGKQLVIKNADFSVNGMENIVPTWYINYDDNAYAANTVFSSANKFYVKHDEITRLGLDNTQINFIKVNCKIAGIINIGKVNGNTAGTGFDYNVTSGINIIHLRQTITLSQSVSIYFAGNGIIRYWTANASDGHPELGWGMARAGSSNVYVQRIPIDLGFGDNV